MKGTTTWTSLQKEEQENKEEQKEDMDVSAEEETRIHSDADLKGLILNAGEIHRFDLGPSGGG